MGWFGEFWIFYWCNIWEEVEQYGIVERVWVLE